MRRRTCAFLIGALGGGLGVALWRLREAQAELARLHESPAPASLVTPVVVQPADITLEYEQAVPPMDS